MIDKMDSRKLIINQSSFEEAFTKDRNGLISPRPEALPLAKWIEQVKKISNAADRSALRRIRSITENTDVVFTYNPEGNTPVIGAGFPLFGDRPLKGVKRPDINALSSVSPTSDVLAKLEVRAGKINEFNKELYEFLIDYGESENERFEILRKVEIDQSLTGGGLDNNHIGDITKSAMNFITKGSKLPDIKDTVLSEMVVRASRRTRDRLVRQGFKLGSLEPIKYSKVRFEQDNDGLIGFPVYASAYSPLTDEIAQRLSLYTGVNCRELVGKQVTDYETGEVQKKARVLDALEYTLSQTTYVAGDYANLILNLARIQKHGWKVEKDVNGIKLISKKGKGRSVYPSASMDGAIEAMVMEAFNNEMQRLKIDFMPSLQNKETRVESIFSWIKRALTEDEYDVLSADWSGYDMTLLASVICTIIMEVVKPFFKPEFEQWFWAVIYGYAFKVFALDTRLMDLNPELALEMRNLPHEQMVEFELYPCINGLLSGKKGTHTIGSLYGMVVVHYCIPWQLQYEPLDYVGAQAGDDTLMGYPRNRIKDTPDETYEPIELAASEWGLEMNAGKQIFHRSLDGELIKVFLQESYHVGLDIRGVGSIARPYAAVFFSERDKRLSVPEQLMAEISRMNQGSDSPFVDDVVRMWLDKEQILAVMFQDYGIKAFEAIIASAIGERSIEDFVAGLDVGSFTFGNDAVSLIREKSLPILTTMADVSASMDLTGVRSTVREMVNDITTKNTEVNSPVEDLFLIGE